MCRRNSRSGLVRRPESVLIGAAMSQQPLTGHERPGDACTIVIFGASGDLTKRKLLPALYNLKALKLLPITSR